MREIFFSKIKHMRSKQVSHRFQRGYTLIELSLWLIIVSALLVGMLLLFLNSSNAEKANESVQEVTAVVSAVHGLYQGQPDYGDLADGSVIANLGHIPAKWRKGNAIVDPFGSPVLISNSSRHFIVVQFSNIPTSICIRILVMDFGSNMFSVSANGNPAIAARAMTPEEAHTECNDSNNENYIIWNFF